MEHRCLSPWKGAVVGGLIAFAWSAVVHGSIAAANLPSRVVAAFLWTWIIGKIPGLTLKAAALYGLFFGLCVAVLSSRVSALGVADAAIGWTLASLALSRCYAKTCALPA